MTIFNFCDKIFVFTKNAHMLQAWPLFSQSVSFAKKGKFIVRKNLELYNINMFSFISDINLYLTICFSHTHTHAFTQITLIHTLSHSHSHMHSHIHTHTYILTFTLTQLTFTHTFSHSHSHNIHSNMHSHIHTHINSHTNVTH